MRKRGGGRVSKRGRGWRGGRGEVNKTKNINIFASLLHVLFIVSACLCVYECVCVGVSGCVCVCLFIRNLNLKGNVCFFATN